VTEVGGATGLGAAGRCITVSLPRDELDRITPSTIQDILKPDFVVREKRILLLLFLAASVCLCKNQNHNLENHWLDIDVTW